MSTGRVRHIQDGQPVKASVASRPDRDLEALLLQVQARLNAASLGEALVAHDVTVATEVVVGTPVYWDSAQSRYAPALAAVATDSESGALVLADSANVLGVVLRKTATTRADVLLSGLAELDISAVLADDVQPGRYYLSGVDAGRLTPQRPPVGIVVLTAVGDGKVHVAPIIRNFLEDHVHYRFVLDARPAGTVLAPDIGEPHTILEADATLSGWLPADHESFEGLAPTGAQFGYNLAAHPQLSQVWPPIPLDSAALMVERPPLLAQDTDPALGGTLLDSQYVTFDANGIWWMTNCYNQAPWPADYSTSSSSSSSSSLSDDGACGPAQRMRIVLFFSQMLYATDKSVVTSLAPLDADGLLELTNCADEPATTGDLKIQLNLEDAVDLTAAVEGSLVLKSISNTALDFGPVVEGLKAGTNIQLVASRTRPESDDAGADTIYQGIVEVHADSALTDRELPLEIIKLEGARERTHETIPHIGFPAGLESGIRIHVDIPAYNVPTSAQLVFRAYVLGRTTGTLPELTMSARVLATPEDSPVTLPTEDDLAPAFPSTAAVSADQYVLVESDPITVTAGNTVYATLLREADDGYAGEVGILRLRGVLQAGA